METTIIEYIYIYILGLYRDNGKCANATLAFVRPSSSGKSHTIFGGRQQESWL